MFLERVILSETKDLNASTCVCGCFQILHDVQDDIYCGENIKNAIPKQIGCPSCNPHPNGGFRSAYKP